MDMLSRGRVEMAARGITDPTATASASPPPPPQAVVKDVVIAQDAKHLKVARGFSVTDALGEAVAAATKAASLQPESLDPDVVVIGQHFLGRAHLATQSQEGSSHAMQISRWK